jgi:hypothetical protein
MAAVEGDWMSMKGTTTKKGKRLTPAELRKLAEKLVLARNVDEASRLIKLMERGFYGD